MIRYSVMCLLAFTSAVTAAKPQSCTVEPMGIEDLCGKDASVALVFLTDIKKFGSTSLSNLSARLLNESHIGLGRFVAFRGASTGYSMEGTYGPSQIGANNSKTIVGKKAKFECRFDGNLDVVDYILTHTLAPCEYRSKALGMLLVYTGRRPTSDSPSRLEMIKDKFKKHNIFLFVTSMGKADLGQLASCEYGIFNMTVDDTIEPINSLQMITSRRKAVVKAIVASVVVQQQVDHMLQLIQGEPNHTCPLPPPVVPVTTSISPTVSPVNQTCTTSVNQTCPAPANGQPPTAASIGIIVALSILSVAVVLLLVALAMTCYRYHLAVTSGGNNEAGSGEDGMIVDGPQLGESGSKTDTGGL